MVKTSHGGFRSSIGPPGFRLLDGLLSTGGHFLPYGARAFLTDDWVDRWLPMKYHMNPYDSGGFNNT